MLSAVCLGEMCNSAKVAFYCYVFCVCSRSFCIWNIYWDFTSKKCGFI